MNEDWLDRLVDLIKADGRGMKPLSRAAGLGENFIQQMIKDRKVPSIEKLMAILDVLGGTSAIYVLTGFKLSSEDLEIIKLFSNSDERRKKALLTLLQDFQSDEPTE